MSKVLVLAGIILAHVSLGDFNAGHYRGGPQRRPRYQRVRPSQAPASEEPAHRRTFITALLAAEVAYLEGLLADQATVANNQQPAHHQGGKGGHTVQHSHKHSAQHSAPYQAAAKPVKYVSKLDPFYMIAAPDLTKESPKTEAYDVAEPETTYDAPAVTTTTAKYGELEHYNLGNYLPPPAKVAPQYDEPAPAPAYAPPPNTYQIATTTAPPPATTKSYSGPANSLVNSAPAPAYEKPAPAPAYQKPKPLTETKLVLVPSYPRPSPSYAPGPPSYSSPPSPSYAAGPSYHVPQQSSYNPHPHTFFHDAQASKVHDKSDQAETKIEDSVGSSSNDAPIQGSSKEFPTIFYNNLGESSKNQLIL